MKSQLPKCTAIKSLLFLALMWTGALACAGQAAGTVINLSGPVLAQKADGTVRLLGMKSGVEPGDTLFTQKNGYAQIKFSDDSRLILQPNTTLTIEAFSYDAARPDGDSAIFNLASGGLRWTTGLLGERSKEKFSLKTPDATVGIRGTTFVARWVPPAPQNSGDLTREDSAATLVNNGSQQGKSPSPTGRDPAGGPTNKPLPAGKTSSAGNQPSVPPALLPGLHLEVVNGAIVVTNAGGSQGFQAGQFGYVPDVHQPPVVLPPNSGLQFIPPPSFNGSQGPVTGNANPGNGNNADCVVR